MLSVEDYLPGAVNFTVTATDIFDQSVTIVVPVFIPGKYICKQLTDLCTNYPNFLHTEPFLDGHCNFDLLAFTVNCNTTLDATLVPLTYTCSYDGGPEEICMLQ